MDALFKEIFGIFKFFEDFFIGIQKLLMPPKAYSWQTFIYLSAFSGGLSYFATGYIKDIIAFCGWLFLIAGTAWYTTDDPLKIPGTFMPVGAVITGFLVSVFAFGHQEDIVTSRTIVLWPTIAALITAIPEFFEGTGTDAKAQIPKLEDRQKIIVLVGCCMMLSCWIQFYFVLDNWVKQYPSLLVDKVNSRTFVVKLETPNTTSQNPSTFIKNPTKTPPKNGLILLNRLQPLIEEQIVAQDWSVVEKWLINANRNIAGLGETVITRNLLNFEEQKLWRVETRVMNIKSGYQLDILTIWTGPSSNRSGYYLKRSCRIEPIGSGNKTENKNVQAEITCDRSIRLINGAPPPKQ
jgi:hypothetical protein